MLSISTYCTVGTHNRRSVPGTVHKRCPARYHLTRNLELNAAPPRRKLDAAPPKHRERTKKMPVVHSPAYNPAHHPACNPVHNLQHLNGIHTLQRRHPRGTLEGHVRRGASRLSRAHAALLCLWLTSADAFTPANLDELKAAKASCLSEAASGNCPNVETWHGKIGTWNIAKVTSLRGSKSMCVSV